MDTVEKFFATYQAGLLARDEKRIAALYAVPSLILFPGTAIAVSDPAQTEQFFAGSWDQYAGVTEAEHRIRVMGEAPGTVWADVTWRYDGADRERFCYQLVERPQGWQIGVLTMMDQP